MFNNLPDETTFFAPKAKLNDEAMMQYGLIQQNPELSMRRNTGAELGYNESMVLA